MLTLLSGMAGAFEMMANTYDERTSGHDDRVSGSFYDTPGDAMEAMNNAAPTPAE